MVSSYMRIFSSNEWDTLKSIIVGTADTAHWPRNCPDFRKMEETTLWKDTPLPVGPVAPHIVAEANRDLTKLVNLLESLDVTVYRPTSMNFYARDGLYNYCPRDRLLVVDGEVIDTPMAYQCREQEIENYKFLNTKFVRGKGKWDAANVCRLNDDLLYLVSESGDREGAYWLQDYFADTKRVHILDTYTGVHIDSTISPVREGLVVLNGSRITEDTVPKPLKNWDKIWVHDMVPQSFVDYPYASKWIGMNFLTINPKLVVCDPKQLKLRKELKQYGVETEGVDLRHSRTLGGGHHCVTLDLLRAE
jgi:scyllo-inosamine-4-phosphate amidinotransferase 1